MAANLYQRSFSSGGWQRLSNSPLIMDVTIIVVGGSKAPNVDVRFLGSTTPEASWPSGATVHLKNVDLSMIEVNVLSGQNILVVGQAP